MKLLILPVLTTLCLINASAAQAILESRIDSRVTAATVFPDRALVTRSATSSLAKGDNTLIISGLPASLLTESLRVAAEADGQVTIGSVESRRTHLAELAREREKKLNDEVTALEDKLRGLDDQIKTYTLQLGFIESIGKEMPKNAGAELVRGDIKPDSWRLGWETLGAGAGKLYESMRKIEQDKRGVQQQLAQKRRELSEIQSQQRESTTLLVNLSANTPSKVRLAISYQVPDASWQPVYDARLDADSGRISLSQWGQVRQNTGEDWSDARLVLSTARPAQESQPPVLEPWFIDFYRPQPRAEQMRKSMALEADATLAAAAAPAPYEQATLVSSEFSAEYRISGSSSVPSDNATHRFAISEQQLDSQLSLWSVPKFAPVAYLQAKLKYDGKAPLLSGPVSLFRDGVYIGNAELPVLRPGGEALLAFGTDDKVRIDYRLENDTRSASGFIDKQKRIERSYRIEVTSHHARPVDISIQDQLPVARDERIKVEWLKGHDAPSVQDLDGRSGVAAWNYSAKPQDKHVIRFGYGVSYPKDMQVPGFE